MINSTEIYREAGEKTAKARKQGDEATAIFHYNWARRAIHLESGKNVEKARKAFDEGYKSVPR